MVPVEMGGVFFLRNLVNTYPVLWRGGWGAGKGERFHLHLYLEKFGSAVKILFTISCGVVRSA